MHDALCKSGTGQLQVTCVSVYSMFIHTHLSAHCKSKDDISACENTLLSSFTNTLHIGVHILSVFQIRS